MCLVPVRWEDAVYIHSWKCISLAIMGMGWNCNHAPLSFVDCLRIHFFVLLIVCTWNWQRDSFYQKSQQDTHSRIIPLRLRGRSPQRFTDSNTRVASQSDDFIFSGVFSWCLQWARASRTTRRSPNFEDCLLVALWLIVVGWDRKGAHFAACGGQKQV